MCYDGLGDWGERTLCLDGVLETAFAGARSVILLRDSD